MDENSEEDEQERKKRLKREANRRSAQLSRQRKKAFVEDLKAKNAEYLQRAVPGPKVQLFAPKQDVMLAFLLLLSWTLAFLATLFYPSSKNGCLTLLFRTLFLLRRCCVPQHRQ